MAGNGWRWLEIAGGGWRWLEMAGGGWRWLEMAGDGWRWLELAGDGWSGEEMKGMLGRAVTGWYTENSLAGITCITHKWKGLELFGVVLKHLPEVKCHGHSSFDQMIFWALLCMLTNFIYL